MVFRVIKVLYTFIFSSLGGRALEVISESIQSTLSCLVVKALGIESIDRASRVSRVGVSRGRVPRGSRGWRIERGLSILSKIPKTVSSVV